MAANDIGALAPATASLRGPFRLAIALVGVTIAVILMGAMVTSSGSGLAFADWPLSDGELMPERSLTTLPGFFEHFHRLLAAIAGLLAIALVVLVVRRPETAGAARQTTIAGLVLVCVQGGIGGLHVLDGLPLWSAATHALLAQLTISTFALSAYRLSPRWAATAAVGAAGVGGARKVAIVAFAAVIVQTLLGAFARHETGESQHALWTHVGNAFFVFILLLVASGLAAGRCADVPGVRGLTRTLLRLLVLQIVLGFVALLVRLGKHPENIEHLWRASLITAHVLTGALLTVTTALVAAHVYRGTRRADAADAR